MLAAGEHYVHHLGLGSYVDDLRVAQCRCRVGRIGPNLVSRLLLEMTDFR